MLLLGWMRAVVDWLWSLASGGGGGGLLEWFLSNWKVWLAVLVITGLVVDWLMWMMRWRPYRLLFGRLRYAPAAGSAPAETWDNGVGFYEPETAVDADPVEWTDLTLSTLSEIDPDWAGGVVIEKEPPPAFVAPEENYYSEAYEEPPEALDAFEATSGYWDETPDEREEPAGFPGATPEPEMETEAAPDAVSPYAPTEYPADGLYGEETEEAAWEAEPLPEMSDGDAPGDSAFSDGAFFGDETPKAPDVLPDELEQTSPQYFGRPGLWPGMRFPFSRKAKEPSPAEAEASPFGAESSDTPQPEDFAPDASQDGTAARRRRRRLHESASEPWQSKTPPSTREVPFSPSQPLFDPWADTRPSRVVQPPAEPIPQPGKQKEPLRTVTGKPAKRRGLMRFTSAEEEPIAGLPPMDLTDPFLPAVRPNSPDFEPDEGEEFDTKGK